ncbi:unnamed protein product [Amoebophrya sp. A120]|nr:unnamed protein product [Amoebophrya sp. A120]|eukprot:GSA120T00000623001.1
MAHMIPLPDQAALKANSASRHFGRAARDMELNFYPTLWQKTPENQVAKWSPELVDHVYARLRQHHFNHRDVIALEFSGFLEKYLWPHILQTPTLHTSSKISTSTSIGEFCPLFPGQKAQELKKLSYCELDTLTEPRPLSRAHVLLIALMFMEKVRDGVDAWHTVDLQTNDRFKRFFEVFLDQVNPPTSTTQAVDDSIEDAGTAKGKGKTTKMKKKGKGKKGNKQGKKGSSGKNDKRVALDSTAALSRREMTFFLQFLTHCFNSYEQPSIRESVVNLVGLPGWLHLSPDRLEVTLSESKQYRKFWKSVNSKYAFDAPQEPTLEQRTLMLAGIEEKTVAAVADEVDGETKKDGEAENNSDDEGNKMVEEEGGGEDAAVADGDAAGDADEAAAEVDAENKEDKDDGVLDISNMGQAVAKVVSGSVDKQAVFQPLPRLPATVAEKHLQIKVDYSKEPLTRTQVHARDFMAKLMQDFFENLEKQRNAPISHALPAYFIRAMERFLELLIDLLSQLPFRKCFRPLFADRHFVVRVREFVEVMRARMAEQDRLLQLHGKGRGKARFWNTRDDRAGRFARQAVKGGGSSGGGKHQNNYKGNNGKMGKNNYEHQQQDSMGWYGPGSTPMPGKGGKVVPEYHGPMGNYPIGGGAGGKTSPSNAGKGGNYGAPNSFAAPPPQPVPVVQMQDSYGNNFVQETADNGYDPFGTENFDQWFESAFQDAADHDELFTTNDAAVPNLNADGKNSNGHSALNDMSGKDPFDVLAEQQQNSNSGMWFPPNFEEQDPALLERKREEEEQKARLQERLKNVTQGMRDPSGVAVSTENMVFAGGIYPEDDVWRLSEQLLGILEFYDLFEVDDVTGAALHRQDVLQRHYDDHNRLRKICFEIGNAGEEIDPNTGQPKTIVDQTEEMRRIALSHVGDFQSRQELRRVFAQLPYTVLKEICQKLCYLDVSRENILHKLDNIVVNHAKNVQLLNAQPATRKKVKPKPRKEEIILKKLFLEVLYQKLESKEAQLDKVNALPLFPAEDIVWDKHLVPDEHFQSEHALALPKLNLQFLTMHDYLLRNFHLYRLESTYAIRNDIRDVIPRMRPVSDPGIAGGIRFLGNARMGVAVDSFQIVETKPPLVGEKAPARVRCEIRFSVATIRSQMVQREWQQLHEHDVVFLIALDPPPVAFKGNPMELDTHEFPKQFGIREIRGIEVDKLHDGENNMLSDPFTKKDPIGNERVLTGFYDSAQYLMDNDPKHDLFGMGRKATRTANQGVVFNTPTAEGAEQVPVDIDDEKPFHILIRRNPKENNFKSVLETIRALMNSTESAVVPKWLHRLFLGYGDPLETQYKVLGSTPEIDFRDTFLDRDHVFEAFPECQAIEIPEDCLPPYKLKFETGPRNNNDNKAVDMEVDAEGTTNAGPDNNKANRKNKKKKNHQDMNKKAKKIDIDIVDKKIVGSTYIVKNPGPYEYCQPQLNKVRFTPVQVDAIRSGVNEGLTMVVGPPGTGKTDTAVQIVNLLFHNFPDQKMVLVAHSNQALNDLFDKICKLDIPERYLVRLGRGIEELDSERDFSKYGRIDFMLSRRMELLDLVGKLARSLGLDADHTSYSCETAKFFFLQHVQRAWELFVEKVQIAGKKGENLYKVVDYLDEYRQKFREAQKKNPELFKNAEEENDEPNEEQLGEPKKKKRKKNKKNKDDMVGKPDFLIPDNAQKSDEEIEKLNKEYAQKLLEKHNNSVVAALFPFSDFFDDVGRPLFQNNDYAKDFDEAEGCFAFFQNLWKEIGECLPFEMLRTGTDRGNYLVTTHARIIAMTCTHAALTRANLVKMNFQYDNLIMEESAQILEVETLIPMLLQKADVAGESRLKRVVLIGDHHQLPPVVKNRAFERYGHLDQSLFTRFIRLNVPHVMLDAQGRARPSIASLYNWKYDNMRNLPNVQKKIDYRLANTGLVYDYQFINVPDYNGTGETSPMPYYFQNEGEAEFAVAMFMFMRLLGYPAGSISILTTYNGQKALIRDVIQKRCAWNPLYGWPKQVTTVDKYQGQQNEYIILSLVRTEKVGHLRDVRRLIVAMSRSKLGLYVIGRFANFNQCYELQPVLKYFKKRPFSLALYKDYKTEFWPCERFLDTSDAYAEKNSRLVASGIEEMWKILGEMQEQKAKELGLITNDANLPHMQEPQDEE